MASGLARFGLDVDQARFVGGQRLLATRLGAAVAVGPAVGVPGVVGVLGVDTDGAGVPKLGSERSRSRGRPRPVTVLLQLTRPDTAMAVTPISARRVVMGARTQKLPRAVSQWMPSLLSK